MLINLNDRNRSEAGAVALLMAVFGLVVFVLAALVVDLGMARDDRRQSQNAADAAALAAGNKLYQASNTTPDLVGAIASAKQYALDNYGITAAQWSSCTDPVHFILVTGETECISFRPNLTKPTEVRVRIPDTQQGTGLSALMGYRTITTRSQAQAKLDPGGASECGLCVLGSGMTHDLQNGDATVHGADIHFNGNVSVSNNGLVATDGDITVEGTASGNYANYTPDPTTGSAPITDPLANVTLPAPPTYGGLTVKSGSPCGASGGPGIYGAKNLRNTLCTLLPGLYVISGSSSDAWDMAGNSSTILRGSGVTLLFTCGTSTVPRLCNAGEQGAYLDASGSGFLDIQAPTSGALQGFAIIYDRNNNSRLRLTGNGTQNTVGTFYAANGSLQMNGNGCSQNFYSLIVIRDLEMNGNPACIQSTYNSNQNVQVPPSALHLSR